MVNRSPYFTLSAVVEHDSPEGPEYHHLGEEPPELPVLNQPELTKNVDKSRRQVSFSNNNKVDDSTSTLRKTSSFLDLFEEGDTVVVDENEFLAVDKEKEAIEEKRRVLKETIETSKRFYRENYSYQVLLSHESYVRYGKIKDFKDYKYKSLVEKMGKIQLLTQLVNERNQIQTTCQKIYYREGVMILDENNNKRLMNQYIGGERAITLFQKTCKQEIQELKWSLSIYRQRFLYIRSLLVRQLGIADEALKLVKTFDDVYDYFLIHMDINV